jgi:cytochrome subunit of sulfide dehydrogenase
MKGESQFTRKEIAMMKRFSALVVVGVLICATGAQSADDLRARNWAATCTGCHGTNGMSDGSMPRLAGLDKATIVNAIREFKAGTKPATVMHQHAKGYSEEQIERIAEFFAAQPAN